jgi:hypothetical protein
VRNRLDLTSAGRLLLIAACFGASLANAQLPLTKTQQAGPVRATNATLNGMAVPKGNATMAWFEWGTDRNYGNTTAPQDIGSGNGVVRVSAPLVGLTVGGVYHFRLVASNPVGVALGFDFMFTTAMRVQNWGSYNGALPVIPPGLTNLSGIASGHIFCLGLRNDGTVVTWLVDPRQAFVGATNVPPGLNDVVAVAGGFSHGLALKEDTTVVAWGTYGYGTVADVPANLTNVIAIAGGDCHSVALKADGRVVAWGSGCYSGLTNVPSSLSNVVAISCGSGHTLALKADGTVAVWGGDGGSKPAPASATNVVAVVTMGVWNLALRGDGTVTNWGGGLSTSVPKPTDLTNVVAIATGNGFLEVIGADGTLAAWGSAQDATFMPATLSNAVAIAGGDYHMVGLAPMNLPPNALAWSASGGINNALTISLNNFRVFDPNGDPLSFRITSLPIKGTLYQYTTGGPGAAISTPDTAVTDPSSRVIFVPLADEYGSPYDTFNIVANDGELDSAPATWTLSILPRPVIQTAVVTNGPPIAFVLGFGGVTNASYSVYHSATLDSWTYLGPATQISPGQFSYTDYTITNSAVRFYRVRSP